MKFSSPIKCLAFLALVSKVISLTLDLDISNVELSPDGYSRSTTLAGGTFPGTPITSTKGDNYLLNVTNSLADSSMLLSTTLHWHGLYQAATAWADGVAFVSQCPIVPGYSFLYNFTVPDQAGTYWYHAHIGAQYADGLRGPFIIYDPQDPYLDMYDVDDGSTIITLSDWYHTPSLEEAPFPLPDSVLINGLGRYQYGPTTNLSVVPVTNGQRYRFRLINMGVEANFQFSIDSHTFTIIEADGVTTEPLVVDSLQIFAGQRYSLILEANQTVGNYWIRANPSVGPAGFTDGINSAILRYDGAATEDPTSTQTTSTNPLNEFNLHPLENPGAPGNPTPGGADVVINLDQEFVNAAANFTVNGVSYLSPSVPILLQILTGVAPSSLLPNGSIYALPPNSTVEVSVPALALGGPHPWHLHGHVMDVVRVAGSETYNYVNPVRRDTISTGSGTDNVTFRFSTDNPGPWFFHCHIDWHLAAGLAVAFVEDATEVGTDLLTPPFIYDQLCNIYDGHAIKAPTPQP